MTTRLLAWNSSLMFLLVVAWALVQGVFMDQMGIRIANHTGLAAAAEGLVIAFGWGMLGIVGAAILLPSERKSFGAFAAFNFGAAVGLGISSLALVAMMFGW